MRATWDLRKAVWEFVNGQFETAQRLFISDVDLKLKRTPWRYYYRSLEICNLLALKKYEIVEYKIESFNKLIATEGAVFTNKYITLIEIMKKYMKYINDYKDSNNMVIDKFILSVKEKLTEERSGIDSTIEIIDLSFILLYALNESHKK
jgi:hypothetical protein